MSNYTVVPVNAGKAVATQVGPHSGIGTLYISAFRGGIFAVNGAGVVQAYFRDTRYGLGELYRIGDKVVVLAYTFPGAVDFVDNAWFLFSQLIP